MRHVNLWAAALAALIALLPQRVFAGGAEIVTGGTRGIGRGGANAVSVNDSMALLYNPAALSKINTNQFLMNFDTVYHDICVDPYGYYGWGVYEGGRSEFADTSPDAANNDVNNNYLNDPLGQVCNSGEPVSIPQMAMALKLTDDLGIAFGFANNVGLGNAQWGGADGTIRTDNGARPTPTRYQLVASKTTPVMALSVGAGYRALPWLSFGATLQWLGAKTQSDAVQASTSGTSPHNDMFVRVKAQDYFVPTATLSVHAQPTENIEVMLAFRWSDAFNGSGDATYTTNYYQYQSQNGAVARTNDPITLDKVYNRLPWSLTLGGRYADVIKPRAELRPDVYHPGDSLDNERWDVELNVVWNMLGRASDSALSVADTCRLNAAGERILVRDGDDQSLGFHRDCQLLQFQTNDPVTGRATTSFDVPPADGKRSFDLNRHWQDQLILRLGGSYNPIPNQLGVNAGVFYETRGIDAAYANIDSMPFARFGLSAGVTVRVGRWDIMVAYAHVFQETLVVAPPAHQNRQEGVATDPTSGFDQRIGANCTADAPGDDCAPVSDPSVDKQPDAVARGQQSSILEQEGQINRVVNAGKYTANYDVLSLGFNYRF